METLYVLLVLLVVTRLFGEAAVRLGQPALVGELVSGICLGMIVGHFSEAFPILSGLDENEVFRAVTDLGVFFLMLLAGLEMRPKDIAKASAGSLAVAVCGLALPFSAGFALGWIYLPAGEVKLAQATFVGTALSITAVPVAARVLMDLGKLETKAGQTVVAAAVFDDVLSLLVLAVLTALIQTGGMPGPTTLLCILGRTILFFAATVFIGRYVFPLLGKWVRGFQSDELEFSFLLIAALGFAVLAEALHLHFILGAFVAGLFFLRRTFGRDVFDDVKRKVSGVTTGFLAPVFFASIGFHLELSAVTAIPGFLALLIAVAFLTKLVGAGVPAYFVGLPPRAATAVGVAMSARGAVELIIADIALRAGLFSKPDPPPPVVQHMFSAIVIVAVLTTIAVPILLRPLLGRGHPSS